MRRPHRGQCRPLLAVAVDVLPIVLTDWSFGRRSCAGRVLGAAGDTYVVVHSDAPLLIVVARTASWNVGVAAEVSLKELLNIVLRPSDKPIQRH
jgi:hypothetical protein